MVDPAKMNAQSFTQPIKCTNNEPKILPTPFSSDFHK